MSHVGDAAGSKSKPLADRITDSGLLSAWIWCVIGLGLAFLLQLLVLGLDPWPAIRPIAAGLAASGLGFLYMWRLLWLRLQGFTGDGLGAAQQVCEIAFYFGLALTL
jgi:adenosylcobinamide-GDP ribazoletransferase